MVKLKDLLQCAGIVDINSIELYIIELWKQHLDFPKEDRIQLIRETLLLYMGEDGKTKDQQEAILSAIVESLNSMEDVETDTTLITSKNNNRLTTTIEDPESSIEKKISIDDREPTSREPPPCEVIENNEIHIKEHLDASDSSVPSESEWFFQTDFKEENHHELPLLEMNEEAQKLLISLYPSINPDALSRLLIQVRGDFDRAIRELDNLLSNRSMISDHEEVESRPVCRYFLAGECLRHDCQYSHEIHNQTCRFWLENKCIKGDSCEFFHGFLINDDDDNDIKEEKEVFPDVSSLDELTMMKSLNLQEFPSLDETTLSTLPSKPKTTTFADKAKLARIKEEFADIDELFVENVYLQYEKDLEATRHHLHSVLGFAPSTRHPISSLTTTPTSRRDSGSHSSRSAYHARRVVPAVWVTTGDSLREQYETIRENAIKKANLRNSLFEQATQAYISGDKSRAATLSKQARLIDQSMRQLNHEAAELIFHERNAKLKTNTIIDLHGLHRDEALSYLEERIEHLRAEHYHGCLHVILGTGHHSKSGHGSRLLPSIEHFLKTNDFTYVDSSKDKRGGMLSINID